MMHSFRKYIVLIVIVIMVAVGLVFYFLGRNIDPSIDFVIARKTDLVQEVNVTGRVKPVESVDLAFEKTGSVLSINVSVGDVVSKGDFLVQLKNDGKYAELEKAKANVKIQIAKLQELKQGSTVEEINVQKVKISNAQALLIEAKRNLIVKLNDAFTKTDDAVRNNIDKFIHDPRSSNPQISFQISDSSLETGIEFGRIVVESVLNNWSEVSSGLTVEYDLVLVAKDIKEKLTQVREFLDKVSLAVNALNSNVEFPQTIIDSYKSSVSIARTNVNIIFSNISVAEEKVQTAQSSLALEQQELALKIAGTRSEKIEAQEARVEEAQAFVRSSQTEIDKTYLFAPIGGVITKQEVKVGEIVSANEIIISIISESEFEIESNVPEADIAKIQNTDTSLVTLDAYGSSVVFETVVTSIDPAETIIEGVATYKVVLQFVQKDERVRSGMTANIDIKTGEKKDVVAIPFRAVIIKDGENIVRILDDQNNITEVPVIVGLRSSEGSVEIVNGISEGDKVVVFIEFK